MFITRDCIPEKGKKEMFSNGVLYNTILNWIPFVKESDNFAISCSKT